jgi:hypothetical protein
VFYLLAVKVVRCRVETIKHLPCRWKVRGLIGTCDFHDGQKHGFPELISSGRLLALPLLMWPRHDLNPYSRPEPQPTTNTGPGALSTAARSNSGYDRAMMVITAGAAIIALASFIRDVMFG